MVGVAGKSKACKTCKTRRVKCGFERPQCRRCVKAQIQCSGYQKTIHFINRTSQDFLEPVSSVTAQSISNSKSCLREELDRVIALSLTATTSPLSEFRRSAYDLLQKLYLPQPQFADGDPSCGAPFAWVRAVCELAEPCILLDYSLVALCTTQVYVARAERVSLEESAERYHAALRQLCSVSSWEGDARMEYILASVVILSTCEIFVCSTDDGWRLHVQGVANILSMRKNSSSMPRSTWDSLCSRLRLISVVSQVTHEQQKPVTSTRWQSLMFDYCSTHPFDLMIDTASNLPEIFKAASEILGSEESLQLEKIATMNSLQNALAEFRNNQADIIATSCSPLYSATPTNVENPSDNLYKTKLFPLVLSFRSLQIAGFFVLCWAFQLHIHMLLLRLTEPIGPERPPDNDHDHEDKSRNEAIRLARNLCQSVEYCHRIEMGAGGPQTMLYARWVMHRFFEQLSMNRELDWCRNIANMSGKNTRFGVKLMAFQDSHCYNA